MKFTDLMDMAPHRDPAEQQRWADERFPAVVAQSPLSLWSPGDAIPQRELRLLLGVAPAWNRYDLVLLDLLASRLPAGGQHNVVAHVFDTDHCTSLSELREYFPAIENPTAWPLAGLWIDGQPVRFATGDDARRLALNSLGIRPEEFESALQMDAEGRRVPQAHSSSK